jgi:hypothetical protein
MQKVRSGSRSASARRAPRARSRRAPVQQPVTADHLVEEGARPQPQPEHRDTQHQRALQRDLVLSQGIIDRVQRQGMVASVDLDGEPDIPEDIEIDRPPATSRTTCRLGSGNPRARHKAAKSSSPSERAPSHTSRTTWSMKARFGERRCSCQTRSSRGGATSRCCTARHTSSAACRSETAHWAAWMVAHSGATRGTPTRIVGARRRRRARTPATLRRRLALGTDTSMTASSKPSRPCPTSAAAPSSTAPEPLSQTACHRRGSVRVARSPARREPGGKPAQPTPPTMTVCRPPSAHRPAATSARTANRSMPWRASSRRCTTPPCSAASLRAIRPRSARFALDSPPVSSPATGAWWTWHVGSGFGSTGAGWRNSADGGGIHPQPCPSTNIGDAEREP